MSSSKGANLHVINILPNIEGLIVVMGYDQENITKIREIHQV